jgi:hypothetical protein
VVLQRLQPAGTVRRRGGAEEHDAVGRAHCPGQRPPCLAVKRPARPYKSRIENRVVVGSAKAT